MTQPPNAPHSHPDARIDHVLNALRTAKAPTGLERRVAQRVAQRLTARLAHTAEARTPTPSFFAATDSRTTPSPFATTGRRAATSPFAVILHAVKDPRIFFAEARPYTLPATALILLLAIVSITSLKHQSTQTATLSKPTPSHSYAPAQPAPRTAPSSQASIHRSQAPSPTNTQVPQRLSLESPTATKASEPASPPPDPDAIALAETLAPSRPAPLLPLTPQENLLLAATRPGQPIEIAELEPLREPALRAAAEAREHAGLERFVHRLLAPLVVSESLNPTPQADLQPEPTSSNPDQPSTNGDTPHAP